MAFASAGEISEYYLEQPFRRDLACPHFSHKCGFHSSKPEVVEKRGRHTGYAGSPVEATMKRWSPRRATRKHHCKFRRSEVRVQVSLVPSTRGRQAGDAGMRLVLFRLFQVNTNEMLVQTGQEMHTEQSKERFQNVTCFN